MKTFDLEEKMPRLPIPELKDTLGKYLESLKPLATEEEYNQQVKKVDNFVQTVGPNLQQRLLARDKTEKYSWLEEWWSSYAYMEYRDSILINVTYGITFEESTITCQIERAAVLANGLLVLKRQLEEQTFPQDKTKSGEALCMSAYRAVFHSCRIPQEKRDITEYYPFEETNMITVIKNNNFYVFNSCFENGEIMCPSLIKQQLINVLKLDKQNQGKAQPVQILACLNRDDWFRARNEVISFHPANKKSLEIIQKSAFLIVLDNASPVSITESSRYLLCGNESITNRFYDSPLQLVCFKNGKAGIVGEHSRMDGQPVCVVSDLLLKYEVEQTQNKAQMWTIPPSQTKTLSAPKQLSWHLSPEICREIDNAIFTVRKEISNLDSIVLESKRGKKVWKKVGCSPDAAVQLALQMTYYSMHNKFPAVYESVSTRHFRRGRTETGRSLSSDSKNFVEGYFNPNISESEKIDLFLKAEKSHVKYAKNAAKGHGCDRHLLGLKLLQIENKEPLHPLFTDPLFSKSSHWNLSTSTLAPEYITSISFGAVVSDGYGICYTYREKDLNISVTNFVSDSTTDSRRFAYLLEKISKMFNNYY